MESATAHPGMASPDASPTVIGENKDASHGAFYSGFAKGAMTAIEGLALFVSSPTLRAEAWKLLKPIRNAEIVYASAGVLIFLLLRDPADDLTEFFWTLSRWSRLVTVFITLVLNKRLKADSHMLSAALREKNIGFAIALDSQPKARRSIRHRLDDFKRVAKIGVFKTTGAVVRSVFPSGRYIADPAVKFVTMRPVLGTAIATAVAAVHAIPSEMLHSTHVDDVLLSFAESVVDAEDFGSDIVRAYVKTMNPETKVYFLTRYRGYLVGCGFVYSMISSIPFLGVPMALVAECGAACLIVDIVERNLEKETRMPLPCEESLRHDKHT